MLGPIRNYLSILAFLLLSWEIENSRLAAEEISISEGTHCFLPTEKPWGRQLYVFGPKAPRGLGAEDAVQVAFFRFRADLQEDIYISVFDPDSSGSHDPFYFNFAGSGPTLFTIYGGPGAYTDPSGRTTTPTADQKGTALVSKKFVKEYDNQWYHFGPLKASDGEIVKGWSYFKVVVQALEGGFSNNFRLAGSPKHAGEAFVFKLPLHLQLNIGELTQFFFEVPKGMTKIVEMDYDIDASGGTAYLDTPKRSFKLTPSSSGKWIKNEIELSPEETGARCVFRFIKGPQKLTNMIVTFTDPDGTPLRIFSSDGPVEAPPPSMKIEEVKIPEGVKDPCLAFIFDGSKSHDPDNENLTFEWDFGDGTPKSNQIKVAHAYEKAGTYTVTLTVNDGSKLDCAVSKITQEVIANTRPIPDADTPEFLDTKQPGTFDASKSTDTPGDILSFAWDFGDGQQGTGVKLDHAYEKGGLYTVKLTVKDDKNTRCSTAVLERKVRVNGPPVANAGPDVFLTKTDPNDPFEVTFDGTKSTDPDGDKLTYIWDFGDGTQGEGPTPKHVYPKGGTYTAKLTVQDNSGFPNHTDDDDAKVVLNRAPTAILGDARLGCTKEDIIFDATRSVDLDGDALTYLWDFGDGSQGEGAVPKHRYQKPGTYTVSLTVDDGRNTNISRHTVKQTIRIVEPPVAIIKPVQPATTGQILSFEADHEKNPDDRKLAYIWDFGDGEKAEGKSAKHAFPKGGAYKVKLTVEDDSGLDCGRAIAEIGLRINTPPVPDLQISDKLCCIDQPVRFDASKSSDLDGDGLKFHWDFGDGNVSEEPTPVHIYRTAGTFKIVLTVTDTSGLPGNTATATAIAKINRGPVAVITVEQP